MTTAQGCEPITTRTASDQGAKGGQLILGNAAEKLPQLARHRRAGSPRWIGPVGACVLVAGSPTLDLNLLRQNLDNILIFPGNVSCLGSFPRKYEKRAVWRTVRNMLIYIYVFRSIWLQEPLLWTLWLSQDRRTPAQPGRLGCQRQACRADLAARAKQSIQ